VTTRSTRPPGRTAAPATDGEQTRCEPGGDRCPTSGQRDRRYATPDPRELPDDESARCAGPHVRRTASARSSASSWATERYSPRRLGAVGVGEANWRMTSWLGPVSAVDPSLYQREGLWRRARRGGRAGVGGPLRQLGARPPVAAFQHRRRSRRLERRAGSASSTRLRRRLRALSTKTSSSKGSGIGADLVPASRTVGSSFDHAAPHYDNTVLQGLAGAAWPVGRRHARADGSCCWP